MDILNAPVIMIAAGVVILLLGIGAGMLISSVSDENEEEAGTTDQAPPGGRKGHYQPVARLWRQNDTGALVVEVEGKSFVAASGMSQDLRSRVETAARDLRGFLGMGLNAPTEAPQPAMPKTQTATNLPASTPAPEASTRPVSAVPYAPTPAVSSPQEEAAALGSTQKSIVMQIEDILQDMIAGTELVNKGVHLIEDPVKGVIVRIGLSHYEGIDSVPDPQIKATIRSAVAEWEKMQ